MLVWVSCCVFWMLVWLGMFVIVLYISFVLHGAFTVVWLLCIFSWFCGFSICGFFWVFAVVLWFGFDCLSTCDLLVLMLFAGVLLLFVGSVIALILCLIICLVWCLLDSFVVLDFVCCAITVCAVNFVLVLFCLNTVRWFLLRLWVADLMLFVCWMLLGWVYVGFGVCGIALSVIVLFDLVFIFIYWWLVV